MSLEITNAVPQTVLYFSLFLQKDNHYRSLFCFMHSPSHPLFQVHPHMTTTKKIAMGAIRKERFFSPDEEIVLKKSWLQPTTASMVPASYANKVLRKQLQQNVVEDSCGNTQLGHLQQHFTTSLAKCLCMMRRNIIVA